MAMTEAQWLTCTEPRPMLERLESMGVLESNRKYALLVCACSGRVWALLSKQERRDVEAFAAFAEGSTRSQPAGLPRITRTSSCVPDLCVPLVNLQAAAARKEAPRREGIIQAIFSREEAAPQVDILRDIYGNPFHPSPFLHPAVLAWSDATVRRMAEGIYEGQRLPEGTLDTARLAILADALLDAGCDDEGLIQHCRGEGPHVRGCWAINLILGKA
jgi:hypothetical protein